MAGKDSGLVLQRPSWNVQLKWTGRIIEAKSTLPSHAIISGSMFHSMAIAGSSHKGEVMADICLKFVLKPFARQGRHSTPIMCCNNREGLSLWVELLNPKDYKHLILCFETKASVTGPSSEPNYINKPQRILVFAEDSSDQYRNEQCVLEEFAVLSHWIGTNVYQLPAKETFIKDIGDVVDIGIFSEVKIVRFSSGTATINPDSSPIPDLKRMYWSNNNFPDIKLKPKDRSILSAHKFILVARSPYFCRLFHDDENQKMVTRNADALYLERVNVNVKPLRAILEWMYTGEITEISETFVEEILQGAELFELDKLPKSIEKQIIKLCNVGNMFQLAILAKKYGMSAACKFIKEFIKKNIDTFDQND